MIPNICHFVFGLREQEEDFKFCHYLAVLSASAINKPTRILFHYTFEPSGRWWDLTKSIENLELVHIVAPSYIGNKPLACAQHKADIVRLNVLYQHGGIYLDIDTICVRSWEDLLDYDIVLGKEEEDSGVSAGICNAVILSSPRSRFLAEWLIRYRHEYSPHGAREASAVLPLRIATSQPSWLTLKGPRTFFTPGRLRCRQIFNGASRVPPELITLHLWGSRSSVDMNAIDGWAWADEHPETLYAQIMQLTRQAIEAREQEESMLSVLT